MFLLALHTVWPLNAWSQQCTALQTVNFTLYTVHYTLHSSLYTSSREITEVKQGVAKTKLVLGWVTVWCFLSCPSLASDLWRCTLGIPCHDRPTPLRVYWVGYCKLSASILPWCWRKVEALCVLWIVIHQVRACLWKCWRRDLMSP